MDLSDRKNYFITLIVCAVLVAIGLAVYFNHKSNKANPAPIPMPAAHAKGQFQETYGYYTVNVPSGWLADTFMAKANSTISLVPTENTDVRLGPNANGVDAGTFDSVDVYKANPDLTAWEDKEQSQAAAKGIVITNTTVNGQPAFLETESNNGNKILTYYIWHGANIVRVSMLVTEPSLHVDNSQYVNQFNAMTQSLKILK